MPRTAKAATATKNGKSKIAGKVKTTEAKRTRRSPYDLVQELRAKRDDLIEKMTGQLAKLDERIAKLEEKHEHKIRVSELLHSTTPEELEKQMEEMKKQQTLLRKALKQSKK
ncbi:hypothetical protein J7643_07670 [bacterium]|nr:hypothetical protein [bacterium]